MKKEAAGAGMLKGRRKSVQTSHARLPLRAPCAVPAEVRYLRMQSTEYNFKLVDSAIGGKRLLVHVRNACSLFSIFAVGAFWATALMASIHRADSLEFSCPIQSLQFNSWRHRVTHRSEPGSLSAHFDAGQRCLDSEQRLGSLQRSSFTTSTTTYRIGWRLGRICRIKIGSSRDRILLIGIISNSATTRSALCKRRFGEWEPIRDKSTEYSDLTRSGRSRNTK